MKPPIQIQTCVDLRLANNGLNEVPNIDEPIDDLLKKLSDIASTYNKRFLLPTCDTITEYAQVQRLINSWLNFRGHKHAVTDSEAYLLLWGLGSIARDMNSTSCDLQLDRLPVLTELIICVRNWLANT